MRNRDPSTKHGAHATREVALSDERAAHTVAAATARKRGLFQALLSHRIPDAMPQEAGRSTCTKAETAAPIPGGSKVQDQGRGSVPAHVEVELIPCPGAPPGDRSEGDRNQDGAYLQLSLYSRATKHHRRNREKWGRRDMANAS